MGAQIGAQALAGMIIPAGGYLATVHPTIDFETYSAAGYVWDASRGKWASPPGCSPQARGLGAVGLWAYAEHPTTEVLTLSYDLRDGRGVRRWRPGLLPPSDLFAYLATGGAVEAHNVMFERVIWEKVCVPRYGWPPLNPAQLRCSMAKAHAWAIPGALGKIGDALNLPVKKDPDGDRLIKLLCMPQAPTKKQPKLRLRREDVPDEFERLDAYCDRDVETEAVASHTIPDLPPHELRYWQVDQAINHRGVAVNRAALNDCIAVLEQAYELYGAELQEITGGIKVTELAQLQGWLSARGVRMVGMDADAIEAALAGPLPLPARRVLEIRAAIGSASVKKLYAMANQTAADDRLHNLIVYHGARTGRPTGEGPQPLNLPKAGPALRWCGDADCGRPYAADACGCPWCGADAAFSTPSGWKAAAVPHVLEVMAHRSLQLVEHYFGNAVLCIAGCVRGLFVSAPGHDLICSDYSAIEAVVTAALAGEQWRIDTIREGTCIYLASASRITGTPVEEYLTHKRQHGEHHPDRQKIGKPCLAPETKVLTDRGYLAIVDVKLSDKLWDGEEWVTHQGLIFRGVKSTIRLDGVRITPDHLVSLNGSWREARELDIDASLLTQALASASGALPLRGESSGGETASTWPRLPATAVPSRTGSPYIICERVNQRGATHAPSAQQRRTESSTTVTRSRCLTTRTGDGCSIGCPRQYSAATTRARGSTPATGGGASRCTQRGGKTAASSYATFRPSTGGTIRSWKWTGKTATGITNPEISGSSRSRSTHSTSAGSTTKTKKSSASKSESMNLSAVYDLTNAGPKRRFTIQTNSGHLIVHNCELGLGFGGWLGAWRQFDDSDNFDDNRVKDIILAWRDASPAIVEFWGGQRRKVVDPYTGRWEWRDELYGLEGAAIRAVQYPGPAVDFRGIRYQVTGDVLYCTLPSGRRLSYHQPRLGPSDRRPGELQLTFMTHNKNPKMGPIGWVRMQTYGGRLCENCIAEGTPVLTDRGWVPIERVRMSDRVHDGVEFVNHKGLLFKSVQTCVRVDGVWMTPDHEVLTDDGWKAASQRPRPYRPAIRDAGLLRAEPFRWEEIPLALCLRLRRVLRKDWLRSDKSQPQGPAAELRVPDQAHPVGQAENPRYESAPCVRGLAFDAGPLSAALTSGMAQLRGPWYFSLRRLAGFVRSLLAGHGRGILPRVGAGPAGQQRQLHPGELPLGYRPRASEQQEGQQPHRDTGWLDDFCPGEQALRDQHHDVALSCSARVARGQAVHPEAVHQSRVFDLLDAGPRHRFVVRGDSGPFIVHNCVQATASDILRYASIALEEAGYPIVLHVYDEIVSEVPEGWGSIEEFERIMAALPSWAAGWPIRAAGGWRGKYYRKE